MKTILVPGGAGYIGSHTVVELIKEGYEIIVVDNYSNSSPSTIDAIEKITHKKVTVYNFDIRDKFKLNKVFQNHKIDGVINFAGYKAVGESVEKPLMYFDNNLNGMIGLMEVMELNDVYTLVFSSSATVYGIPDMIPIKENSKLNVTNPYARTKLINESLFSDLCQSNSKWRIIALRYFNPLGAHESGDMGENPNGIPNNLAPFITQVAIGKREILNVFGTDYDTKDGTCIRDYIHVTDLANGHILALKRLLEGNIGFEPINLGSGIGYSVFDIINAFEEVIEKKIPYKIIERRPGDIDESIADIDKAKKLLGWYPKHNLKKMCSDSWKWQKKHPNGYKNS